MSEPLKFFISYARSDAEFVLRLARDLRASGVPLWVDQLDIRGGQRWDHAIERALAASQGMIVVLSPDAIASNNVMDEVSYALQERKLVVPITIRECAVPLRLRRVQQVDFSDSYDAGLVRLRAAIGIGAPDQSTPVTAQSASQAQTPTPIGNDLPPTTPSTGASQDWRADLVEFDETFSAVEKRKTQLLLKFMLQVLSEKGWDRERVADAEFCVRELIENAFQHGIANSDAGTVCIAASLSSDWYDVRITDTGLGFDLDAEVLSQSSKENAEQIRGLARIAQLADLDQPDRNSVSLHLDRKRSRARLIKWDDVHVVECAGRMDHATATRFQSSFQRDREVGARVVVDITRSSTCHRSA